MSNWYLHRSMVGTFRCQLPTHSNPNKMVPLSFSPKSHLIHSMTNERHTSFGPCPVQWQFRFEPPKETELPQRWRCRQLSELPCILDRHQSSRTNLGVSGNCTSNAFIMSRDSQISNRLGEMGSPCAIWSECNETAGTSPVGTICRNHLGLSCRLINCSW